MTIHGSWKPDRQPPKTGEQSFCEAIRNLSFPIYVVDLGGRIGVAQDGIATLAPAANGDEGTHPLLGWSPPLSLEALGDSGFKANLGIRYAYICGAMANGITSTAMVEAAGRAGMIGFFGAGGLSVDQIESAINTLQHSLGEIPFGFNLIHSPNDMALEQKTVDLYLARGVRLVSASAYLDLTTPLVQYRLHGIHRDDNGKIIALQARITANTGAYGSYGIAVASRIAMHATGPYEIENVDIESRCVYTNTPFCGAMRGFGNTLDRVANEIIKEQRDFLEHGL